MMDVTLAEIQNLLEKFKPYWNTRYFKMENSNDDLYLMLILEHHVDGSPPQDYAFLTPQNVKQFVTNPQTWRDPNNGFCISHLFEG